MSSGIGDRTGDEFIDSLFPQMAIIDLRSGMRRGSRHAFVQVGNSSKEFP